MAEKKEDNNQIKGKKERVLQNFETVFKNVSGILKQFSKMSAGIKKCR